MAATQAQNAIPVFSPSVSVRYSTTGTTVGSPNTFGTSPLNLSCPDGAISAVLSGALPAQSTTPTDLLVDNYISITANGVTTNLCGPTGPGGQGNPASCFRKAYSSIAAPGVDPDTLTSGGVAPIDISSYLAPGANQVTFDLVDFGGFLASSSINLITNCNATGVSGNGKVTGNPIPTTNPTPAQLTQPFTFSGGSGIAVQLLFDLSTAYNAGTLNNPNGATPTVVDSAIDPAVFPDYVAGTSFATSQCLIHLGELYNSQPACKLYTLTCQTGTGSAASGVQCPDSSARNIVIQDVFDFPPLSLPDITYTNGNFSEVFHQGFGLLEAAEGWTGGPCTFDPAAGQKFSCPENLLTLFSGPGLGKGTGTPSPGLNSSFISVGPVPEYRTHVDLSPWANQMWVNSHNITATFNTRSPILPADFNDGNLNGFKAAPLYSITYGISPVVGTPSPGFPIPGLPSPEFPVPGDVTLYYPNGCSLPAPVDYFAPPVQLQVAQDGKYLLHYFATDCAGTEELYFLQDKTGSWETTFYTAQVFVDTVNPHVDEFPTLSPPMPTGGYNQNQTVTVKYQCADDFSGVATCGTRTYAKPIIHPAGVTDTIDTSKPGTFTYTVKTTDAAGNVGHPHSVTYKVVGSE
jgi:hypothetical protein